MSQYADTPQSLSSSGSYNGTTAWVGWIAFAGTMMVLLGTFHLIQGLVAIFKDEYFLVAKSGLIVSVDYTAWGWAHLIAGLVVMVAGFCVFAGQTWARVVGVLVALVSAVVNIAFLGAYPIWSMIMIALAVVVILALTVHGSDINAGA